MKIKDLQKQFKASFRAFRRDNAEKAYDTSAICTFMYGQILGVNPDAKVTYQKVEQADFDACGHLDLRRRVRTAMR